MAELLTRSLRYMNHLVIYVLKHIV